MRSIPSIASMLAQQPRERADGCRRSQVAPVGVDVLPEQRHLAHAVGGHRPDLGDELVAAAALTSRPRVEGTMQYEQRAVAADADLQPALERARAPARADGR